MKIVEAGDNAKLLILKSLINILLKTSKVAGHDKSLWLLFNSHSLNLDKSSFFY